METNVGSPPTVRRTSPFGELAVDLAPERVDRAPLRLGEGAASTRGSSWMRVTRHLEVERRLGATSVMPVTGAALAGQRRARERDVAFAGEQSRGRVEADPSGAGNVGFGPRVQVGEVLLRAARPVERLLVGGELDEVARGEARGDAEVAQDLHQQPGRNRGTSRWRTRASAPGSGCPASMRTE